MGCYLCLCVHVYIRVCSPIKSLESAVFPAVGWTCARWNLAPGLAVFMHLDSGITWSKSTEKFQSSSFIHRFSTRFHWLEDSRAFSTRIPIGGQRFLDISSTEQCTFIFEKWRTLKLLLGWNCSYFCIGKVSRDLNIVTKVIKKAKQMIAPSKNRQNLQ